MTPQLTTIECINLLLTRVPELKPVYDEHMHDYEELLPHVFLGDVTRYVVTQARCGEISPGRPLDRILDVLNQCLAGGDEQVKELVAVSFVENLLEHEEVLTILKELIGPHLQKEFKDYGRR